jgi:protein CpxP
MKTQNLQGILLAAAMALPLATWAEGIVDEAPGAPGQGQRADDRRGPPPGGPEGLQEEGGPRGGPHGGPGFGPHFGPGPGFSPGPRDGGDVPPYLHGIALTEAQQDKIFAILHGQVPYLREQSRAQEKADRALFELHGATKYDDAAAVKLAQAAAQADANITLAHLRTEQKVLAVLTAEQRKTLDERRNAHRAGRNDGRRDGSNPDHDNGRKDDRKDGRKPGPDANRPTNQ